jgi:hypothetical protein
MVLVRTSDSRFHPPKCDTLLPCTPCTGSPRQSVSRIQEKHNAATGNCTEARREKCSIHRIQPTRPWRTYHMDAGQACYNYPHPLTKFLFIAPTQCSMDCFQRVKLQKLECPQQVHRPETTDLDAGHGIFPQDGTDEWRTTKHASESPTGLRAASIPKFCTELLKLACAAVWSHLHGSRWSLSQIFFLWWLSKNSLSPF